MIYMVHVRHARAEPLVAARRTLARELARGRQGQDAYARQSVGLAGGEGRGAPAGAARRDACGRRRPLRDRAGTAAWSCRRGARHTARDRSRPAVAAVAGAARHAGPCAGRRPRGRAGGEVGHRSPAERGDGFAFAGRGAAAGRGRRGRTLPCPRSVGRGAAGDRTGAGEASSEGRHPRPLRRHLQLSRGPMLRARPFRLQPRRPSRPAADRLRAAVRRRRLPGGGRGVRRRYERSEDAGRADQQAEETLRAEAGGAGRRSRHDHQRQDRSGAEAGRARLDHLSCGRPPSRRWQPTTGRCSCRCSTTATWPRSAHPISRASGWSSAAIPPWPPSGRASAKTCSPHPRRISPRSRRRRRAPATRCAARPRSR